MPMDHLFSYWVKKKITTKKNEREREREREIHHCPVHLICTFSSKSKLVIGLSTVIYDKQSFTTTRIILDTGFSDPGELQQIPH